MYVTDATTDAELLAPMNALRDEIRLTLTADYVDPDHLDRLVQRYAAEQGRTDARWAARSGLSGEQGSEGRARDLLTARLLRGADDEWSGRGNDARRSRFDGFREEARKILETIGS